MTVKELKENLKDINFYNLDDYVELIAGIDEESYNYDEFVIEVKHQLQIDYRLRGGGLIMANLSLNISKKIFNKAYLPYLTDYSKRDEVYYGGQVQVVGKVCLQFKN